MALATSCPRCQTSFRVVPDQLKIRRGLVRCGACQHVFSGIDSLRYIDEPAPPGATDTADDGASELARLISAETGPQEQPQEIQTHRSSDLETAIPPSLVHPTSSEAPPLPIQHGDGRSDDLRTDDQQAVDAASNADAERANPANEAAVPDYLAGDANPWAPSEDGPLLHPPHDGGHPEGPLDGLQTPSGWGASSDEGETHAGRDFGAAANDMMAVGCLAAFAEAGLRVPEDIAVGGFDDIPIARYVSPSLTTIRVPYEDLARIATEELVKQIENPVRKTIKVRLEAELVVRRSCGAKA